jgi:hypothetical protein
MLGKAPRIGLGIVLAAAALLAATAAAQDSSKLYRWVDKDGHVHYGDQQPVNNNSSEVNLHSINASDSSDDAAKAAAADKQAAACKQKTEQLGEYQKAASITETDALGNKHEYSPQEKDQLVAKTQKYVDDNCGGSAASADAGTAAGSGSSSSGGSATP